MIPHPLVRPLHRLRPPIRIRVERAEINILQRNFRVEITPVSTVICPVIRGSVVCTFTAPSHEVVRIELLDVRAHLVDPTREQARVTVVTARQVANVVGTATGLVGKLPGHDDGGVAVAGDELLDVLFVCLFDLGETVELDRCC